MSPAGVTIYYNSYRNFPRNIYSDENFYRKFREGYKKSYLPKMLLFVSHMHFITSFRPSSSSAFQQSIAFLFSRESFSAFFKPIVVCDVLLFGTPYIEYS